MAAPPSAAPTAIDSAMPIEAFMIVLRKQPRCEEADVAPFLIDPEHRDRKLNCIRADNGQANGRSDAEHTLIGEQSRGSAGMDENDVRVGLPSPLPNKRDQTCQSLAGVDWVEGQ